MAEQSTQRLVVVSNRLPYVLEKQNGEKWTLKPGSGGLVTALLPVLRDRGGVWIGWPGVTERSAESQGSPSKGCARDRVHL